MSIFSALGTAYMVIVPDLFQCILFGVFLVALFAFIDWALNISGVLFIKK